MNNEMLNFILRVVLIFFAAIASESAFKKRYFAIGFFVFSVWFTFFRLTLLRVIALNIGVVTKENVIILDTYRAVLQSPEVSSIESTLVIVSLFVLIYWLRKQKKAL